MIQTHHRIAAIKPRNLQDAITAIFMMKNRRQKSAGFSLVEIMVAMVIGLIGIIIMLQVYSNFEAQKRITAGGDDAQNAGAIALYGLQRDIQQSGWGISASGVLGCNLTLPASGAVPARTLAMAPVMINPAPSIIPLGDSNTDTLLVVYGNGNGGQEGSPVGAAPPSGFTGINVYGIGSPFEFHTGDRVISVTPPPATCNLSLDVVPPNGADTAGGNLTVASGVAGMALGKVYNLGQAPHIFAYAIRGAALTVCDYLKDDCSDPANTGNKTVWLPIASNIVSMKAQYGHDTLTASISALPAIPPYPTYQVNIFDQATPTGACGWFRTPAIRLALVARNGQNNQTGVTPAAPVWGGSVTVAASSPMPGNTATPISLAQNTNWHNYRYKVFETIAPIRNITTQWVQPGC